MDFDSRFGMRILEVLYLESIQYIWIASTTQYLESRIWFEPTQGHVSSLIHNIIPAYAA